MLSPVIAATLTHGTPIFRVAGYRLNSGRFSPDSLRVNFGHTSATAYPLDSAPPDYPNLRIVEREQLPRAGGGYTYTITAEGIADDRSYIALSHDEECAEEGWDTVAITVYTRFPNDARWRKGEQLQGDPLTGITAEADDDMLTSLTPHGLVTGQLCYHDFTAGFGGLTSGAAAYAIVVSPTTYRLAASAENAAAGAVSGLGVAFAITGDHTANTIAAVAHGLNDGDVGIFPTLTGGAGLFVATVSYYVVNKTADAFQLSLTPGGAVVDFTTAISAGTFRRGSYMDITTDGTAGTLRAVPKGYELLWITDFRRSRARAQDYWEISLLLKGLNQDGGMTKPIKRRISTSSQVVSNSAYEGIVISNVFAGLPPVPVGTTSMGPPVIVPGEDNPYPVEADIPQITVTDSYISQVAPPTQYVPAHWTPPDPPPVNNLASVFDGASNADFTTHYPSGWKSNLVASEQIPGKNLWLVQVSWTYQNKKTLR